MRAPVGVQRFRRIGRPADGGQVREIRTLRVGDASHRSSGRDKPPGFAGTLTTSRLSRRDRPGFTHSPTLRSSRGDRVPTKRRTERRHPPFRSDVNASSDLLCFPRGATFLPPCVFVREVSLEKLLSSGTAIGKGVDSGIRFRVIGASKNLTGTAEPFQPM